MIANQLATKIIIIDQPEQALIKLFCKHNASQVLANRKMNLDLIQKISQDFLKDKAKYLGLLQKVCQTNFETSLPLTNQERMTILILLTLPLFDYYSQLEIPENIFFDTLSDLVLRINLTNKEGISKADYEWLARIFRFEIVKLGELQFEFTHFNPKSLANDIQLKSEQPLRPGQAIISVHIMQESNIATNQCLGDFQKAIKFNKKYFPSHNALYFYCYSWLLNPNNQKLLSYDSNILSFSRLFNIIGHSPFPDMAMERIFGFESKQISKVDLPEQTSLQRKAKENLCLLGVGLGIISINSLITTIP